MRKLKLFVTGAVMASVIFMPFSVFGESGCSQQTPANRANISMFAKTSFCNIQDARERLENNSCVKLTQWASVVLQLQQRSCLDLSQLSQLFNCPGTEDSETTPPTDDEEIMPPASDGGEIAPPSDGNEDKIPPSDGNEDIAPPTGGDEVLPPSITPDKEQNGNDSASVENPIQSTYPYAREILNLVNAERQKAGVAPLTLSDDLNRVATVKSKDMANQNYFSHTSPTYGGLTQLLKAQGIRYSYAGENIAMGQKSPGAVMKDWMNSSGHRANILNASFTQLGVGYAINRNGTPYWTQHFIKP